MRGSHGSFVYDRSSGKFENIFDANGDLVDELPPAYSRFVGFDIEEYCDYQRRLADFLQRPVETFFPHTHDILSLGIWISALGGKQRVYGPPEWAHRFSSACELIGMGEVLNFGFERTSQNAAHFGFERMSQNAAHFMLLARSWSLCFPMREASAGPASLCRNEYARLRRQVVALWNKSNTR